LHDLLASLYGPLQCGNVVAERKPFCPVGRTKYDHRTGVHPYYNARFNNLTEFEIAAAVNALLSDLEDKNYRMTNYTPFVDWLINRNGPYFADMVSILVQRYFVKMDTTALVRLADAHPTAFAETISRFIGGPPGVYPFSSTCLFLLNELAANPKPEVDGWVAAQAKTLPTLLAALPEKGDPRKQVLKKGNLGRFAGFRKKADTGQGMGFGNGGTHNCL